MNKESYIEQYSFNNNLNGYCAWHNSDYYTYVNWQWLGLELLYDELSYHIR